MRLSALAALRRDREHWVSADLVDMLQGHQSHFKNHIQEQVGSINK
jgi:hypothetical protein